MIGGKADEPGIVAGSLNLYLNTMDFFEARYMAFECRNQAALFRAGWG